jgi:AraC-like DNA-binding protein
MQPVDYGSILRSGAALVPDYAQQQLLQQQMAMQGQAQQLDQQKFQAAQHVQARKLDEDARYTARLQQYLAADPKDQPGILIRMQTEFPDRHEALQGAFKGQQGLNAATDFQQSAELHSFVQAGRFDLAANKLKQRIASDETAGQDVTDDREVLAMLESGDPAQQRQASGIITTHVALADPAKFSETYKALNPQEAQTQAQREYEWRVNQFGKAEADKWLAVSSDKFVPVDGVGIFRGSDLIGGTAPQAVQSTRGGDQASSGGGDIATALNSYGYSPAVVAGFLGNFKHESDLGRSKASGDGGTAHGLAQWRNERVANFERVIGKHPNRASLPEQVKFVHWEMQNPEAAGMTVTQRDAILSAKTPEQAASLIDRFYERSNGKSRAARAKAAREFVGKQPNKVTSKAQYGSLPSGAQYTAPDGSIRVKS